MDYCDMGRKVRDLRKARGLTQDELAALLGISTSFLGHIERGSRTASIDTLAALCQVLQVSPAYLMESALRPCDLNIPEGLSEKDIQNINEIIALYCKQAKG